jgi:hypothetical protein
VRVACAAWHRKPTRWDGTQYRGCASQACLTQRLTSPTWVLGRYRRARRQLLHEQLEDAFGSMRCLAPLKLPTEGSTKPTEVGLARLVPILWIA